MLPPVKMSAHMSAREEMMGRCSHMDSAWVQIMPPGLSALCMAWKKGLEKSTSAGPTGSEESQMMRS